MKRWWNGSGPTAAAAKRRVMAERLSGKKAMVTAAGQGIGRAIAEAFGREGARVYASDLDPAKLDGLAQRRHPRCARRHRWRGGASVCRKRRQRRCARELRGLGTPRH